MGDERGDGQGGDGQPETAVLIHGGSSFGEWSVLRY
jgi:hypothetical protein